jgi:hypothetical protein
MGEEAAVPLNMVLVLDFEYRNSWKFWEFVTHFVSPILLWNVAVEKP